MKTVGIPLVLCFKLDPLSFERLDAWRSRYFPPERNHLKAHLTVYHQLPGQRIDSIRETLATLAAAQSHAPLPFTELMHKQGFVGVKVDASALLPFKQELDAALSAELRAQDKQAYRPHVTLTNLGSPKEATKCLADLESVFQPWTGIVQGLELYHYRGGPWEHAATFPFQPI